MSAPRSENVIQIGEWQLVPTMNLLVGAAEEIRLEPRHVDLLVFLAQRPGEVVSADEILSHVWKGMVVGDHSVYQAIAKLRKALGDDASKARYIETVPKRGYRLLATVEPAERRDPQAGAPSGEPPPSSRSARILALRRGQRRWIVIAIAASALLAMALGWMGRDRPRTAATEQDVLVVLPFESLSAQPTDVFLAEGFAIELASLLGQIDAIVVLGPVSAKTASSDGLAPREIGARLDADIVVSGSLRRAGHQLRIAATVTDGRSGLQLWSKIFERDDGDAFELQRSVAREIAQALSVRLWDEPEPSPTPSPPDSREAYESFLLGQYYRAIRSASSLERARAHFERAITLDPALSAAKRDLATTYLLQSFYDRLPFHEALERAEPLLKRCLSETPEDAEVLGTIGLSHYLKGSFGLAEDYLQRAVALSPSYAEGWMWLGLAERQQGRLSGALDAFGHARSLEPLLVTAAVNHANALAWSGHPLEGRKQLEALAETVTDSPQLTRVLSNIALETGDLVGAFHWALSAARLVPGDALSDANLAMILAYLGQETAAAAMIAETRQTHDHGRAAQLYLDRTTLTAPRLLSAEARATYDARLSDSPSIPEIEWRLANARIGLAEYFSGKLEPARERLTRSLAGRAYPIERTDYDLFLCTVLADIERHSDESPRTVSWLERCETGLADAKRQGWSSLALIYVEARIQALKGADQQAAKTLASAVEAGFRNRQLIGMDPLIQGISDTRMIARLEARIGRGVDQAWTEIVAELGCAEGDEACVSSRVSEDAPSSQQAPGDRPDDGALSQR